jgi:peptidyl-prolyl cis-trans isomerase B (cyclophilin B)
MLLLPLLMLLPVWLAPAQELDLSQQIVFRTTEGTFVVSLNGDKVPLHAKLLLARVASGAYDGTSFGFVVKWGLIQGGARPPAADAKDPVDLAAVRSESSERKHGRGTLSLVLEQAGNYDGQFFVCITPQPALDGRYIPVGSVIEGIEVIDRISESASDARGAPAQPPRIEKAELRPFQAIPELPFADTPPAELKQFRAALETSLGTIAIEFLPDLAPNHVRNFLRLAQAGFYDGTAIHRVVRDFVMQGGLLSTRQPALPEFRMADLVRKLKPEFNSTHHGKGIVSMARYDEPDSAETSFFICLGDAGALDNQYTVFGRVIEGMDILDKFQNVPVEDEAPKERLELKKVTLSKKP